VVEEKKSNFNLIAGASGFVILILGLTLYFVLFKN
jgi:hypothetical protein